MHQDLPHHIPDEYVAVWKDLSMEELLTRYAKLKENASRLKGEGAVKMNSIVNDMEAYIRHIHGGEALSKLDVFI